MPDSSQEMLLSPYRVLDLTDERGLLCGKILGDLGADVVQVEPPGGSPARQVGPFYGDDPDPGQEPVLVGLLRQQAGRHPRTWSIPTGAPCWSGW